VNKGWQVLLAFIVIFAAGGTFGALFMLRFTVDRAPRFAPGRPGPANLPLGFNGQMLRNWIRSGQLELSADQIEKIMPLIRDAGQDYQRLTRENTLKGMVIIERLQDQVELILTPEQKAKFEELRVQQRARFQLYQQEQRRRWQQMQEQAAGSLSGG
jgi:hypothetical protein